MGRIGKKNIPVKVVKLLNGWKYPKINMAVALKFKTFKWADDLCEFVNDNNIIVVSITDRSSDVSGYFYLFYTEKD